MRTDSPLVTKQQVIGLVFAILLLGILSYLPSSQPFSSAEVKFTDAAPHGLAIVPASCPSSPHYAGDCTDAVSNGGSGGGVCVPSNICLGNNVINSCTGAVLATCPWGCGGGQCLPPPPAAFSSFTARYVQVGGSSSSSSSSPATFSATGHLQAQPALVRSGSATELYWNVANAESCSLTANGHPFSTETSSGQDGVPSAAITQQTIYTLHCTSVSGATPATIDDQVTVNVVPTYQEK